MTFLVYFVHYFHVIGGLQGLGILGTFLNGHPYIIRTHAIRGKTIGRVRGFVTRRINMRLGFIFAIPNNKVNGISIHGIQGVQFTRPFSFAGIHSNFLHVICLNLANITFNLLFHFPFFVSLLIIFVRVLIIICRRIRATNGLVPQRRTGVVQVIVKYVTLSSRPLNVVVRGPSFTVSRVPDTPTSAMFFFRPTNLLLCYERCYNERGFLCTGAPLAGATTCSGGVSGILLISVNTIVLSKQLPTYTKLWLTSNFLLLFEYKRASYNNDFLNGITTPRTFQRFGLVKGEGDKKQ